MKGFTHDGKEVHFFTVDGKGISIISYGYVNKKKKYKVVYDKGYYHLWRMDGRKFNYQSAHQTLNESFEQVIETRTVNI